MPSLLKYPPPKWFISMHFCWHSKVLLHEHIKLSIFHRSEQQKCPNCPKLLFLSGLCQQHYHAFLMVSLAFPKTINFSIFIAKYFLCLRQIFFYYYYYLRSIYILVLYLLQYRKCPMFYDENRLLCLLINVNNIYIFMQLNLR